MPLPERILKAARTAEHHHDWLVIAVAFTFQALQKPYHARHPVLSITVMRVFDGANGSFKLHVPNGLSRDMVHVRTVETVAVTAHAHKSAGQVPPCNRRLEHHSHVHRATLAPRNLIPTAHQRIWTSLADEENHLVGRELVFRNRIAGIVRHVGKIRRLKRIDM